MTQTVVFTTSSRVSCCGQEDPIVHLCLTSSALLAPVVCPVTEAESDYEYTTIEGILKYCCALSSSCGSPRYQYAVEYDEELLADPDTPLIADNIEGIFCEGCMTDWITQSIGNEVSVTLNDDTGVYTLTSQHGCEYTFGPYCDIYCSQIPVTSNSFDLGDSTHLMRDGWFGRNLILPNTSDTGIRIGTATIDADLTIFGNPCPLTLQGSNIGHQIIVGNGNVATGGLIYSVKTRSTGGDANTILQNGDSCFNLSVFGADGVSYINGGNIQAKIDGTPNVNDMPMGWEFWTRAQGAGGVSQALTLKAAHWLQIFNTTGAPGSNPSLSGYLYVESGALKYRGSGGTVTTIAAA